MAESVQLEFPKKLNKRSFSKVRRAYKKQTNQDLCMVIRKAHRQSINDIKSIKPGKVGKDLRTHLNKLLDYEYALRFCGRKR